ncbi:MAG: HAMP domain-containing histidine kinase [Oscillospiraceae bacterium]|nr:HAMP domain-containing histidine kinase [Oscillospiraceae bacterium]
MRKFLYSAYMKSFAVILFLVSLTLGCFAGIHGGKPLYEEDNFIYDFGSSLEDSYYFQYLLSQPENAVLDTFWELTYARREGLHIMDAVAEEETTPTTVDIYDPTEITAPPTPVRVPLSQEEEKLLLHNIEDRLTSLPYLEYIEYYVNLNGVVFSNTGISDPTILREDLFKYYAIDKEGNEEFYSGRNSYTAPWTFGCGIEYVEVEPLIIATRIRPEYVEECRLLWDKQESIIYTTATQILICGLVFLLTLTYLICVCGKANKGAGKGLWVDKIWAELHLTAMGAFAVGGIYLCIFTVEAAFEKQLPSEVAYLVPGLVIPLAGGLILSSLLSLIRNLKAGLFAKRCGVVIILRLLLSWLWAICKALWKGLCYCAGVLADLRGLPFTLLQIGLLLLYTLAATFFGALMDTGTEGALFFLILLFVGVAIFLAIKGRDMDRIQKGVAQIRRGDLSHGIPEPMCRHLKPMAEDVNHIANGLETSLAARMRAERMKTELITNVSHDLKTPLTSIITYTELLSRVEELPEEARDYIRIIGDKSQKLKGLTQDLFDISKVQSGNEEVQWELLDAALLLEQSLAEERGESTEESLQFCLKTQEDLSFMGDGRKLSRVLGNLIQNAVKYSMPGTRVFLSGYKEAGRVVIECKNTSAYPLDFSPEEIIGRFVRGDSARTTEGNGLGLPIAKSYTELCGGDFRLILDGDLFKVILSFPTATAGNG